MARDPDEFRKLVEEHQRMVFSIGLRLVRDRGTAEEIAQDVFLELYRVGDTMQSADHTRFWLRRVTVHRALDALRRKKRQPEAGAELWPDFTGDHWTVPASCLRSWTCCRLRPRWKTRRWKTRRWKSSFGRRCGMNRPMPGLPTA